MSKLIIPTVKSVKSEGSKSSTVTVAPLQSGYGRTLGNSIRRVLLSSTPGAGATGFSIEGVSNEFSTVDGILEDVVDITLAIKQLRFSSDSEEPVVLQISKKGKGEVTGADISKQAGVELANPEVVICKLTDSKSSINMQIQVEKGVDYLRAAQQQNLSANMIPLDTVFSPVTRVRYQVKDTREGQNTQLDELSIVIDTDGSVTPESAFETACGTLMQQYQILAGKAADSFDLSEQIKDDTLSPSKDEENEYLTKSIEDIDMKARTMKALQDAGVQTVADLLQYSDSDLLALSGFGKGALDEVKEVLSTLGF
ncbi:MAG: DNA-directed polymerase subunit alpha [Patescibacteria group bacterium]|nr:DNA-directed polymerase subunit alpha [Patescibacteria group bacterium]